MTLVHDWTFQVLKDDGVPIILNVHDGDTFKLLLDLGFEASASPWIRLEGVDTPELTVKDPVTGKTVVNVPGIDALNFTRMTLESANNIVVKTTKTQTQSFARYVAVVEVDGKDLANLIIAAGHVK